MTADSDREAEPKAIEATGKLLMAPWPWYSAEERAAVDAVLASGRVNYWTGSECREFERECAAQIGVQHAVALANGTLALELALTVLDVGPGDEVITTPRTFIASASCAVIRGARVVFADVDPDSQNISAETVERVISSRTKAIIAVHLAGWPCEMRQIIELARSHGIAVIEDCAQAQGATYHDRPVGGIGDIGAFSFCQDKIVSTGGEGGLLATNDTAQWKAAWAFKDHGKSYDAVYNKQHARGFRWLHESIGTNWRMTEMQGAIGRIQLRRLSDWISRRRKNAGILIDGLQSVAGLRVPVPPAHVGHAYYKFYVFVEPHALRSGWTRDRIMNEISDLGVPCYSGSCSEVYLEKAFEHSGLGPYARLPVARVLGETSLMFLVHPTLGPDEMARTHKVVRAVLRNAVA